MTVPMGFRDQDPGLQKQSLLIQKGYEKCFETGGFPEVLGLSSSLRIKIHQEYFKAMLFRDIIERYDISHPRAVKDLALKLIDNTGSLYTINKLTKYLKSLGHNVPKSSVSDYLNWFEDAYLLFTVRMFDASLARANVNPKKAGQVEVGRYMPIGTLGVL